jgi:hypothetical protein
MRTQLASLVLLLTVIATTARFVGPPEPETRLLKFEDDEGNYRDNFAEPGVGYLTVEFTRLSDGRFIVAGQTVSLEQAPARVRQLLTTRLKSYNPGTGRIEDKGVAGERGGDQFDGVDDRLLTDLRNWRDSGQLPPDSQAPSR